MSATTLSKQQIMALPVFLGEPDVLKSLQKFPGVQSGTLSYDRHILYY